MNLKDTLIWLFRFFTYKPLPKIKPDALPLVEVKTFDKTGWTRCDNGIGFTVPPDRNAPIEIMREGWDEPAKIADGWQGLSPLMNVIGLYWRRI